MPSGTPSPRSAQTRRFDRPPSASTSNAVKRFAYDSATSSVSLSAVTSIPLGNASPSATTRAAPSAVTSVITPGAYASPAARLKPPPLT